MFLMFLATVLLQQFCDICLILDCFMLLHYSKLFILDIVIGSVRQANLSYWLYAEYKFTFHFCYGAIVDNFNEHWYVRPIFYKVQHIHENFSYTNFFMYSLYFFLWWDSRFVFWNKVHNLLWDLLGVCWLVVQFNC